MNTTTLVTALYDIGRDKLKGKSAHRKFDKYLNWFKNLLSINVPMVIFIPSYLEYYIVENRPKNYQTKIIIREFEDLSAYKNYYQRMQDTIDNMTKIPPIPNYFHECPEFVTAKYETIIFSKFNFLKEVSDNNPFDTEYFIWLDAGTFYQPPPFNVSLPWPDPYKIKLLGDKFLVSDYKFNKNDKTPLSNKHDYLRLNRNEICAYILGGNKIAIDRTHKQFWKEVDSALNMGVINNEQHFLQLLALEYPDDYYCWYRTRYQYPTYSDPLRDRMIPAELSVGHYMGEHYSVNNNITLLTIATKELFNSQYAFWEITAKHFGYNYQILGRDVRWSGFGCKINLYLDALSRVNTPYVVLTDCLDAFFVGSADELEKKFNELNIDLIVGAEEQLWYKNGNYNLDDIRNFFEDHCDGKQMFPNSGFLMGRTEKMIELLTLHQDYRDDQAACIDTIYDGKLQLSVDYKTNLVANIPNYKPNQIPGYSYFEFDSVRKRYRNTIDNTYPILMHFPGKHNDTMIAYFSQIHPELIANCNNSSVNYIGILILIIIVFIIFLLIVNYIVKRS